MTHRHFRQMLTKRQEEINSLVCVGLDPVPDKLPDYAGGAFQPLAMRIGRWMTDIVDATLPLASMYKPNLAFWASIPGGIEELKRLVTHIKNTSDVPVLTDAKRGDIGSTQERYREELRELGDGATFNGYMGDDTLKGLIDKNCPGRAYVGLGRTSNPAAWRMQDVLLLDDERPYWEHMVENLAAWARELKVIDDAGVVMGAAHTDPKDPDKIYNEHLGMARGMVGDDMWFLIPGIGTQGGFVEQTVTAAFDGPGSIAINSSSGIIFASQGPDYAEAAAIKALALRDQIRAAGGNCR